MCQVVSVPLLCFVEQNDKAEPFDVEEVVQEMPRNQRQDLWKRLASLLQDVLQELPPECWEENREEGMEVDSAKDPVSLPVTLCTVARIYNQGMCQADQFPFFFYYSLLLCCILLFHSHSETPGKHNINKLVTVVPYFKFSIYNIFWQLYLCFILQCHLSMLLIFFTSYFAL